MRKKKSPFDIENIIVRRDLIKNHCIDYANGHVSEAPDIKYKNELLQYYYEQQLTDNYKNSEAYSAVKAVDINRMKNLKDYHDIYYFSDEFIISHISQFDSYGEFSNKTSDKNKNRALNKIRIKAIRHWLENLANRDEDEDDGCIYEIQTITIVNDRNESACIGGMFEFLNRNRKPSLLSADVFKDRREYLKSLKENLIYVIHDEVANEYNGGSEMSGEVILALWQERIYHEED